MEAGKIRWIRGGFTGAVAFNAVGGREVGYNKLVDILRGAMDRNSLWCSHLLYSQARLEAGLPLSLSQGWCQEREWNGRFFGAHTRIHRWL